MAIQHEFKPQSAMSWCRVCGEHKVSVVHIKKESTMNWKEKAEYFEQAILPRLNIKFKEGDEKYQEENHRTSENQVYMARTDHDDVNHIRNLHVDVRLREAEDYATEGHKAKVLSKIESAIGYLGILHMRVSNRV
jgi:hypothetical protein